MHHKGTTYTLPPPPPQRRSDTILTLHTFVLIAQTLMDTLCCYSWCVCVYIGKGVLRFHWHYPTQRDNDVTSLTTLCNLLECVALCQDAEPHVLQLAFLQPSPCTQLLTEPLRIWSTQTQLFRKTWCTYSSFSRTSGSLTVGQHWTNWKSTSFCCISVITTAVFEILKEKETKVFSNF